MPSKLSLLKEGYNNAVTAYLKEHKLDSIEDLKDKNPERYAQLNVVSQVADSMRHTDSEANKLLVFMHVLSETISVTPFFGHSEFKSQLKALVKEHMPEDIMEKAKLFGNFRNSLKDAPEQPSKWFKGCEEMGQSFIKKFFELKGPIFQAADAAQTAALLKSLKPAEPSTTKVSNHSMMSGKSEDTSDAKPANNLSL